jgi:hypothetical protein
MVAAAGEGEGLSRRVALPVFVAALAGMAACYALALRIDPLERMRPELNADVLAQKAREAIRAMGYSDRAGDEAYGFGWDNAYISRAITGDSPASWRDLVVQRPSPLYFWYRRSQHPLTGQYFHHDLLTPGIVALDDPAPITPGMMQLTLDHRGVVTSFEAIPPQVQEPPADPTAVDWDALLALTEVDRATLVAATPQWHWLATPDARVAWTGTWPGSDLPLRVEAASLYGRPVALQLIGPWTRPWRTVADGGDSGGTAIIAIYFVLVLCVVIGGSVLASRSLREGRGDRTGALRLATAVTAALWVLWLCQTHFSTSIGTVAMFFLAIVTTVFYGVLFWALYLALEPFVRRHWPQTLVSWTTILSGRLRDPIVGRDVLFGVALGALIALLIRGTLVYTNTPLWSSTDLLGGTRQVAGYVTMQTIYAVRSALFFFYLLFLLRLLLRNQWAAALAFVTLFAVLDALDSPRPIFEGATTFLYFSLLSAAVLRWGLTTLSVSLLVATLLANVPATSDLSAWYAGATAFALVIPVALASWAFYTSSHEAGHPALR